MPPALLLSGIGERTRRCARKTRVEPKGSDSALGFGVFEEFEVVQCSTALTESAEDGLPAALMFEAVGELDVRVREGVTVG